MDKDKFWNSFNELSKNYLKNYLILENLVNIQLELEGEEFFYNSVNILNRFPSTVELYCSLVEQLSEAKKIGYLSNLFFSYLHLQNKEKLQTTYNALQKNNYPHLTVIKDLIDYNPAGNILKSSIFRIKYDSTIQDFASFLIQNLKEIEPFLRKKFSNEIPPLVHINLIDKCGASPFNSALFEMFLKVGHYQKDRKSLNMLIRGIVHEIIHFIQQSQVPAYSKDKKDASFYKFIDEGYAEYFSYQSIHQSEENRIYVNNCAARVFLNTDVTIQELINNWFGLFYNDLKIPIYETATSFAYFLSSKYTEKRYQNLFFIFDESNEFTSWKNHFQGHFNIELLDVLQEWKKQIIESHIEYCNDIINKFEIDCENESLTVTYKSNYSINSIKNIFAVKKDSSKMLKIENLSKLRYAKNGSFKIQIEINQELILYIHYGKLNQKFEIKNVKCR